MGQQTNKYHTSDDGKIFRINDDGSFTNIGNVTDVYEVKKLKENLSNQRRQMQVKTVHNPISYNQDNKSNLSVNVKNVAKITGTCILIGLFLYALVMAIINS